MKNIALFLSITFLFFTSPLHAEQPAADWKETVRLQLNKILPGESFSIESIDKVSTENKEVSGKGTFFKKKGVAFTVQYDSNESIGFFSATMPADSKLGLSNAELSSLAGQNLNTLIPSALKESVALHQFAFSFSKENKEVKELDLICKALRSWEVFSSAKLALEEIELNFKIFNPTKAEKRSYDNRLTGILNTGGKSIQVQAALTEKKEDLQFIGKTGDWNFRTSLQSLTGTKKFSDLNMPGEFLDINLSDITLTLSPYQDLMSMDALTNLGEVNLWLKQNDKKKNDYLATFTIDKDAKLSKINKKLEVIDFVPLAGQKIVVSSADKTKKESSKIPSLAQVKAGVKKGCNFIAKIDLTKLKVDHIIGMKELILSSPLTAKLDNIYLDHDLETDVQMGENSTLKEVTVRLKPSPKNFSLTLLGTLQTQIDKDKLDFIGGVEIVLAEQKINFSALMSGTWRNPLGAQGLAVSNVGLQLGASLTTAPVILPNLALAGDIEIGKFTANAAVAFDTRNPTRSMLSVGFNELVFYDLADLIIDDKIFRKVPTGIKESFKETEFKDVYLEAVPVNMQVAGKSYEAGFRAGGDIKVSGFEANGKFDISFKQGFMMQSSVDPINLVIFKLKGVNGNERPGFLIDLRKGKNAAFAVNGAVGLLGLEGSTDIHLVDKGFKFQVGGKIFGLFQGDITATGKDINKVGEMGLKVKLKNDFFDFVKKDVSGFVKNSTSAGVNLLQGAYDGLKKAEKEVKSWDTKIEAKKKEIKAKQAKYRSAFNAAKKKVTESEGKVSAWNKKIKAIQKKIDATGKWSAERAYLNSKKKTYEASRLAALGVLKTANLGLDGLKWVVSDPNRDARVIALKANKTVSLKSVQLAKNGIKLTKKGLGTAGNAAAWILEKGPDAIVDIKKAEFSGKLGLLSGGAVELKLDVKWLGKVRKLKIGFDFNNPQAALAELSKKLMELK